MRKILLILFVLSAITMANEVKIYKGTSSSYSDVSFRYDGLLTLEEFVAVWFAVRYIW